MLWDTAIVETVVDAVPVPLAVCFLLITYLGSLYVVGPATAVAALWGSDRSGSDPRESDRPEPDWQESDRRESDRQGSDRRESDRLGSDRRRQTWIGIILGAYAIFVFLKPLTAVPRPAVESPLAGVALPVVVDHLHGVAVASETGSFPSGHTLTATVFYGLVVIDTRLWTFRKRLLGAAIVVALVGVSRIVLAVHYPGDVIAGLAIGVAYLGGAIALRQRSPWDPFESTIALAAVLSLGGLVAGRPVDSLVMLATAGLALVWYRYVGSRPDE